MGNILLNRASARFFFRTVKTKGPDMKHAVGEPPRLPNGQWVPLSPGVAVGGLLFVSGQLAFDGAGAIISDEIEAQTHQVIANIETVLREAGSGLADVVKITGWLVNPEDFSGFNAAYSSAFSDKPPARSMVRSDLLVPGALVELEAIAVIGTK